MPRVTSCLPVIPCVLFLIMVLIHDSFSSTDEPVLSGILFDQSGVPVKNADVCLYRSESVSGGDPGDFRRFPKGAARCRKTDKNGAYSLYLPDRLPYVLLAVRKDAWAMRRLVPDTQSDTIVTRDTLRRTGSLSFTVVAEKNSDHRAVVYLCGTPFSFTSDTSGRVQLKNVPSGSYGALIQSVHKGYRAVRCSLRVRSAETDVVAAPLSIPLEQVAFVQEPVKMITAVQVPEPAVAKVAEPVKVTPVQEKKVREQTVPEPAKKEVPLVIAPGDTFIGLFEPLQLRGSVKGDTAGVSLLWDVGATGRFLATANGTVEIPPFKAPVNRLPCILRGVTSQGTFTTDTTFVYAGLLWISITPPKELLGRNGHALVNFKGELFLIGGNNSDVWSSPDGITWTLLTANAPFGKLTGHTATVFGNRIWLIGGKTSPSTFSTSIWSSQNGITWQREGSIPFDKRIYHTTVVHDGKLILIGGISDSEQDPFLNDVWTSGDGRNWALAVAEAPFARRYGHGCTVFKNRIMLIGGFNDAIGSNASYGDVWESADGKTWSEVSGAAPFAREKYHSVTVHDDKLWLIGGYERDGNNDRFTDVLFTADGAAWTRLTPGTKSPARFFCTSISFNNKILVSPSDSPKFWIMR